MKILKSVFRRMLDRISHFVQEELDSHDKLFELGKSLFFTMDFTFVQNSLKNDCHY
jgi:hypothetical protein